MIYECGAVRVGQFPAEVHEKRGLPRRLLSIVFNGLICHKGLCGAVRESLDNYPTDGRAAPRYRSPVVGKVCLSEILNPVAQT
jgi:hypothetical protein